jgi:ribonucleoside-diphosphate reductase alpha chain
MATTPERPQLEALSQRIWDTKYRLKGADGIPVDATIEATFARVARTIAAVEPAGERRGVRQRYLEAMCNFEFLPAGRILAGAGSKRAVTLFNCFVMGAIEDSLPSIFDNVKEAALTMQQGGGIGHDFSTLRPRGALVASVGADASGPVSFMDVWDAMCRTIASAGQRRGAMMATLRCDHPDIEEFIEAKSDPRRLRNFNLSVLATDAFMAAVKADADWPLVFGGKEYRRLPARGLWQKIMRATYDYAEPGVIFIDRINAENNLAYCETIYATNPCGEQPLPPYGACLLGSINLAALVREPFTPRAHLDEARLDDLAALGVRFLDATIDASRYPLAAQRREALAKRRIGLGITGLADALAMCGVRYGTRPAIERAEGWMRRISHAAYAASSGLAREKGVFPLCDTAELLRRPAIARLPDAIRRAVARDGLRNGLLTSIAPTGTISLLAGNVSSGIEPIFDLAYERAVLGADGRRTMLRIEDYAYRTFRAMRGADAPLPDSLVRAGDLTPGEHLAMQAAVQRHVDSSISKTINCPEDMTFASFERIYLDAFDMGLKGCTTYRPNPVTGAVLSTAPAASTSAEEPRSPSAAPAEAQSTGGAAQPRPASPAPAIVSGPQAEVFYMSRPLEREAALAGFTYKLRWPDSDHAMYVTINDIEKDGRRRPFEIFINSKNLEHYAWTVALTRMISAVFRRGGDVAFVVEELKAVFDPRGGQWMGGRYVPSLLAAIGEVIERHMIRTGFLRDDEGGTMRGHVDSRRALAASIEDVGLGVAEDGHTSAPSAPSASFERPLGHPPRRLAGARDCPRCGAPELVHQEGCWVCLSCGHSRCG